MSSYQFSVSPHWNPRAGRRLATAAVGLALLGLTALVVVMVPAPSTVAIIGTAGFLSVGAWLVLSDRYELSLAVVMLYLGLLDGFLKLKTGTSYVTFGRDVLLWAIVIGILARGALSKKTLQLPPLSAWVIAWVIIILLEMFHPEGGVLAHRFAGMRPHLEFVPLFFLGYHVMRSTQRLRVFLVLLAIIGAANGLVSLVQFSLSPSQVAAWGPGYSDRINGEGVAPRTFQDASGEDRVRPFGLGSDSGQGGIFGMLALPAALTLLAITRGKRYRLLAAPAAIGVALAVITSQGRGAVIATAVTLLGFAALSIVSSKRIGPTLVGIGLAVIVVFGVTSALSGGGSSGSSGSQFRYSSIAPGKVFGTAEQDRGHSYKVVPKYIAQYPLGAGLGSVGPASQIYASRRHFNGETEFSYLLIEGGIGALLVILGLHIQLLGLAFTRIRKLVDRELRALLAAIAAPLIGILALYFGGAPLSGNPSAPYFWFTGGALAFWLTGEHWKRTPIAQASAQSRA